MPTDLAEEFKLLVRSRHPIVAIDTADEERAVELVRRVAKDLDRPLFEWSSTTGLCRTLPTHAGPITQSDSIKHALSFAHETSELALFLFKDVADYLKDPLLVRSLRDVHALFMSNQSTLVLLDLNQSLPDSVRRLTVPFDVRWPDAEELEQIVRETFREARLLYKVTSEVTRRQMDLLVQSLRGLTRGEAARVVSSALYDDYKLDANDLPRVIEAKRGILASGGVLESILVNVAPDDLGGMERLKAWLARRRGGFTEQAKAFGLAPPRGILLLGVQGGGKSLCAKVVASDWGLPLLRLDPGVLYQKFVGETESRLRSALSQAETMAPVVLWVDEIEKAFASASSASADGGLSQRMFGSLLSWMQEHSQPVFIVATANDVSSLPPELMRKGRFDEVFFVDLPGADARKAIFAIHLRKRGRSASAFDLSKLADAADGFSGAEIEQVIISALYSAFAAKTDLSDAGLLSEIRQTRPLSVLMAERVAELRAWAAGRCVPAD